MENQDQYIQSIDRRLSRIESDVKQINARLAALTVKVAGVSAFVAFIVVSGIKWFISF